MAYLGREKFYEGKSNDVKADKIEENGSMAPKNPSQDNAAKSIVT